MRPKIDKESLQPIVLKTGEILRRHFTTGKILRSKKSRDILHEADIAADSFIKEQLSNLYPGIPILSEENVDEAYAARAQNRFIIDPLDGTINYSRGIEEFGVALSYQENRQTIFSLVYKPVAATMYVAQKGKGSFKNDIPLKVSTTSTLQEAIVAFDPDRENSVLANYINPLHARVRTLRSFGCAIQALGLIAEGKIDAYVYDRPKIWDIEPIGLAITEAGGLILNHDGTPWDGVSPVVVCTAALKPELLSIIEQS